MPNKESNVAIYLDFENLAISAVEVYRGIEKPLKVGPIVKFAEDKGQVRIKKVYADWSKKKFAQYQRMLIAEGFELIHLPETNLLGKNGSDMRLVIDVMGQLQDHPHIDTLIIGSGDSDFIPLIQHMQNRDKEVIVIGFEHSVSEMVKNYCTEFKSLADIIGPVGEPLQPPVSSHRRNPPVKRVPARSARTPQARPQPDGRQLVLRYLRKNRPKGPVALSVFKQDLLVMNPDFSERELGFNSFKKFVKSLKGDLVTKLEKVEKRWLIHFNPSPEKSAAPKTIAPKRTEKPDSRKASSPPRKQEETKSPEKSSPEFQAARELVKRLIREREGNEPLPLARLKPHLQNLDPDFSEKKLGYRYFKNFAHDLMGDLIEKVEKEGQTLMVYFRKVNGQQHHNVKEKADSEEEMDASRGDKQEENKPPRSSARNTRSPREKSQVSRQPSPRRQRHDASDADTAKKSASPVKKEAQQYLAKELHYNSRLDDRMKMASALIEGFGMYPIMTQEQIKTFVRERSKVAASDEAFRLYVQILKHARVFVPSEREGDLANKLLTLNPTFQEAEQIDSMYIERIGQMVKSRFKDLTTDELLDVLF